MNDAAYRRRLASDLEGWVKAGVVGEGEAARMLADLGESRRDLAPIVIGTLAALLFVGSVVAFVAANWDTIPRLLRMAGLLVIVAIALAGAILAERRSSPRLGDLAATVAVLVFASAVALVGQMYHFPEDWPGGYALVGLVALLAALLLGSSGALIVALLCAFGWLFTRPESAILQVPWPVLPPMVLATLLSIERPSRWTAGLAALLIAVVLVLTLNGLVLPPLADLGDRLPLRLVAPYLLLAVAVLAVTMFAVRHEGLRIIARQLAELAILALAGFPVLLFTIASGDLAALGVGTVDTSGVAAYLVALAVVAVAMMAVLRRVDVAALAVAVLAVTIAFGLVAFARGATAGWAVQGLALAACIAVTVSGVTGGRMFWTVVGALGFAAIAYVRLIGTDFNLIDTSAFFLVSAVVFVAIALGTRRLDRRAAT